MNEEIVVVFSKESKVQTLPSYKSATKQLVHGTTLYVGDLHRAYIPIFIPQSYSQLHQLVQQVSPGTVLLLQK